MRPTLILIQSEEVGREEEEETREQRGPDMADAAVVIFASLLADRGGVGSTGALGGSESSEPVSCAFKGCQEASEEDQGRRGQDSRQVETVGRKGQACGTRGPEGPRRYFDPSSRFQRPIKKEKTQNA